ncbi:MAG: phage integrase SAM-like domain-containing protein [Saprospiraceae bacterium]|nr:phage integrase SAM-like domain-containing protein [Saprospiraceae bacterium]
MDTIDWDKIREEEKSKIGTSIINSTINQLRTVFDKMMVFYLSGEGKHPSRSEMKEYLDRHYKEKQNPAKKRIEPDSICLINYFEQLLKLWGANGRVKPSTIVVYNRSLNILKKAVGETLPSNHLNKKTIETIVKYMRSRKKEDSYIKKTLETIKTLVNYATDDVNLTGITENPVQTKDYGLKDRASDKIYLYQDEVDSIAALDLSNDQRRDIVRDIFLLATYTGPRFSDVNTDAKWEIGTDENGRSFLKYRSIKTDKLSMLPLNQKLLPFYQNIQSLSRLDQMQK